MYRNYENKILFGLIVNKLVFCVYSMIYFYLLLRYKPGLLVIIVNTPIIVCAFIGLMGVHGRLYQYIPILQIPVMKGLWFLFITTMGPISHLKIVTILTILDFIPIIFYTIDKMKYEYIEESEENFTRE